MKYNISPPMSRRGSCYVNAMAENFFSILKTECIYRHRPASFEEANVMIDRFIYFCNHERIQLKTGEAPLSQRLSHKPLLFLPGAFLCCRFNRDPCSMSIKTLTLLSV